MCCKQRMRQWHHMPCRPPFELETGSRNRSPWFQQQKLVLFASFKEKYCPEFHNIKQTQRLWLINMTPKCLYSQAQHLWHLQETLWAYRAQKSFALGFNPQHKRRKKKNPLAKNICELKPFAVLWFRVYQVQVINGCWNTAL